MSFSSLRKKSRRSTITIQRARCLCPWKIFTCSFSFFFSFVSVPVKHTRSEHIETSCSCLLYDTSSGHFPLKSQTYSVSEMRFLLIFLLPIATSSLRMCFDKSPNRSLFARPLLSLRNLNLEKCFSACLEMPRETCK